MTEKRKWRLFRRHCEPGMRVWRCIGHKWAVIEVKRPRGRKEWWIRWPDVFEGFDAYEPANGPVHAFAYPFDKG